MTDKLFKQPKEEIREIVIAMLELAIQNGHAEVVTRSDGKQGYRITEAGRRYLFAQSGNTDQDEGSAS